MKIKLNKSVNVDIVIPDDVSGGTAIHMIYKRSWNYDVMIKAFKALTVIDPKFDMKAALTEYTEYNTFVVKCIQDSHYVLLDYIFGNELVSPDFVNGNGSPLILYAMQSGTKMFQYMISRGARLVIGDDLVKNTGRHKELTAIHCARGNIDILSVLFNVVLTHQAGKSVMNIDTIRQLKCIGITQGRSKHQIRHFEDRENNIIRMTQPDDAETLQSLVDMHCTFPCRFNKHKDANKKDVLAAMNSSLTHNTLDTYNALRSVFPSIWIQ